MWQDIDQGNEAFLLFFVILGAFVFIVSFFITINAMYERSKIIECEGNRECIMGIVGKDLTTVSDKKD